MSTQSDKLRQPTDARTVVERVADALRRAQAETSAANLRTLRERIERAQYKPRQQRGGALAWFLALLALAGAGVYAGHHAELRVREAQALHCARLSDGTDSDIAECYARRDLPTPEDY